MLPWSASPQAMPARMGRAVPLIRLSPRAARGPMSAVLTALMAEGSTSPSVANRSSMAAATPTGMAETMGWVRNSSMCRSIACVFSSGVS